MRSAQNTVVTPRSTPLYVRLLAGLIRPFPNFDFGFIKPVRRRATALLQLRPGDRVLDAGCGSGAGFPYLVAAVGPTGRVVGVEISAASVAHASQRSAKNDWSNVEVLLSGAQDVHLTGFFDGLLMFAAPDVYATESSLKQLIPHLQEGARVVFFGSKVSERPFGWVLNSALNFAMTRLSLATTPGLEAKPWRLVAEHLGDLVVEEYFYGWMFLAAGTFHANPRNDAP